MTGFDRVRADELAAAYCAHIRASGGAGGMGSGYRFEGLDLNNRWLRQSFKIQGQLLYTAKAEREREAALAAAGLPHPGWTLAQYRAGEASDAHIGQMMDAAYRARSEELLSALATLLRQQPEPALTFGSFDGLDAHTRWSRQKMLYSAYVAQGPTAERKRVAALAERMPA